MTPILYAAAAFLGYRTITKGSKKGIARPAGQSSNRLRNCGTNTRCDCRSRR